MTVKPEVSMTGFRSDGTDFLLDYSVIGGGVALASWPVPIETTDFTPPGFIPTDLLREPTNLEMPSTRVVASLLPRVVAGLPTEPPLDAADDSVAWPAAIASAACFAVNLWLLRRMIYLHGPTN